MESLIEEAFSKGIVYGFPDGRFLPDNPVTAIESYAIAFRAAGLVDAVAAQKLPDWRTPYIEYYENNAYDDVLSPEVLGLDENLTREKALYILLRTRGINFRMENEETFAKGGGDTMFGDVSASGSYALYIRYAKDNGIISGYRPGEF